MLRRKETYTNITPIPSSVPRQLALDILHSHSEIITLNPLVLSHQPIPAPRDAVADEYYSTWYSITERVQYLPGFGKIGASKISFKGCFQNFDWGLQTHMYAPMGIDIQSKWRIGGIDESSAAQSGMYLREDITIECNRALVSFVKNQLKAASKVLVDRLIRKAELLDAGVLMAMREDGKLMTFNPADLSDRGALQKVQSIRRVSGTGSRRLSDGLASPNRSASVREMYTFSSQYRGRESETMAVELPGDFIHSEAEVRQYQELPDNSRPSDVARPGNGDGMADGLKGNPMKRNEGKGEAPYEPYRPEKG